MKIKLDLPWGGVFEMERHSMSKERAEQITGVLYALIAAVVFVKFFGIMTAAFCG